MDLYQFDNAGIMGRDVHGFLLANTLIESAGTTAGLGEGPVVFGLPGAPGANGLLGAGTLRNVTVSGGIEHNAGFYNLSAR